jgi:hypothetical protein
MIQPITGDPVTTTQDLQFLSDPLSQAMKTVLNPDYLETLYKKKIVTVDTSGLVINENNNLVVDYRANVIPILQSSIENIAAIKAEQELSGTSVLTQVPKGLIQSFTELDGITLVPDSPIYKILNIFYETYLTDNSVITKALGGIPLVSNCIYLHKNVLTTFFETNVSSNQADRILFSHNKDILMPVINFREHGYDYLQLGRYHIITPIQDEPTPLYIFSTSGLKSEQSICGIGPAKTISTIDQSKKILEPGSTNVINTLGYYNTNLVNFVSNTYGA